MIWIDNEQLQFIRGVFYIPLISLLITVTLTNSTINFIILLFWYFIFIFEYLGHGQQLNKKFFHFMVHCVVYCVVLK